MSDIDPKTLRRAFARFMSGVTVVTTCTDTGERVGFTANSFTSVSLDPPLLLVCPGRHLSSFDVFDRAEHFAVSVLAEGQERVSDVFASAAGDRFAEVSWRPDRHDSPLVDGACAWFSCRVHRRHEAGDHQILVGRIVDFAHSALPGLGYGPNGYFNLGQERLSDAVGRPERRDRAGALVEHDGRLLLVRERDGLRLPAIDLPDGVGPRSALQRHFDALGPTISLGPVYSVYEDGERRDRTTFFRARARSGLTSGLGTFVPIDALVPSDATDPAEAAMLSRFVSEHRHRHFGFYLGTDEVGEVHDVFEGGD